MNRSCLALVALCSMMIMPLAQANTIYSHGYSGGAVTLDGVAVDVGTGTWEAGSPFSADGAVAAGAGNNTPEGGALLPFTPVDGIVYTLEASVLNDSAGWIGLGFAESNNGGNLSVPQGRHAQNLEGWAWMLTRNSATGNDQEAFDGNRTNNPYAGGDFGDPTQFLDMKVVLDTTAGAVSWTAEYFVNGSSLGAASTLGAGASDISYVGFSRDITGGTATAAGSIRSFSLTQVPEPSTVALALVCIIGFLGLRRR